MRTILIPLILICSLTQFENVQAGKRRIKHSECNYQKDADRPRDPNTTAYLSNSVNPYSCYAPEICTETNLEEEDLSAGAVARVSKNMSITADCPAIVRYYYHRKKLHIWLASYQELQNIDSIEYIISRIPVEKDDWPTGRDPDQIQRFSCKIEDGKIVGRYGKTRETYNKVYIQDVLPNKLECKYDIEEKEEEINNDLEYFAYQSFIIKGVETKYDMIGFSQEEICDRKQVYFNDTNENDSWNLYEKVQYKIANFYCNDFYELEFRKEGSNEYEKGHFECSFYGFRIGGQGIPLFFLDARCTAAAKYFCDYDVKAKRGKRMPDRVKPSWNPRRESSLKCPPEKPHLVIIKERSEKQIPNAKIECLHHGADQFWTVDGEILYEDGPEVYCTNTVECNPVHMIPASSVINGFLDRKDFLPRCYNNGILYVDEKKVLSKECDSTDGKFKYSVDEEAKLEINQDTKFVCKDF